MSEIPICETNGATVLNCDALRGVRSLADESVDCILTSPPYFGVRDYQVNGQIGLERTVDQYVARLRKVFAECRRVLRSDGTLWLNIADSYSGYHGNKHCGDGPTPSDKPGYQENQRVSSVGRNGYKQKELMGVPWLVSEALRREGWYRRSAIIWAKPNGMPGSQVDRCTSSYEFIFLFSKSARYWSDFDAIKTPPRESTAIRMAQDIQKQAGSHRANGGAKTNGTMKAVGAGFRPVGRAHEAPPGQTPQGPLRDKQRGHSRKHEGFNAHWDAMSKEEQQSQPAMMRDVWFVSPAQSKLNHYAVMPDEIARRCILAGCRPGGIVLDPFAGTGTSLAMAVELGRSAIGIELNPKDILNIRKRLLAVTAALPMEAM